MDLRSTGGAEPLVLLPGMNCSARLWSRLELGDDRQIITPTLTEPTLAGQVERLIEQLPERFGLIGLSLGGIVAMALARLSPNSVTRLCLMSTNPNAPTVQQQMVWSRQRAQLAGGRSARDLQQDLLPSLLSRAVIKEQPAVVEQAMLMADEVGADHLDAQLRLQSTRVDERPALHELVCPTLVIAARDDQLCSVDRHVELSRLIAGSALVVVDQAAHLSPLERPDELSVAIRHWLSERSRFASLE
jgi:pimeloyl-ACP methyl ester carboxylesterase